MRFATYRTCLAVVVGLVLVATGLWAAGEEEQPAAAADKQYVTDPVTGKVVVAPQYGGTITQVLKHNVDRDTDPYSGAGGSLYITSGVLEKLSMVDWAIDRDTYPFLTGYQAPLYALTGALAESWEQPDATTYVFHVRQGVHWHDKPPVNGRELTADDVAYSYHRLIGNKLSGTEFSDADPSPGGGNLVGLPWESIEATDEWTVVMKLTEPKVVALGTILDWYSIAIHPREVIDEHGDMADWRTVVGTGPYMITDIVPQVSLTWTKNPNYWGYDEKYPDNRLPYIDEMKGLEINEVATMLAGLRSGKIDFIGWPGASQLNVIDQAVSLQETNPELVIHTWSERSNAAHMMNMTRPPFTDVRVRHAMQMALDLEAMNATYFLGYGDTIPRGMVGREFKEAMTPFEEWPEELTQYYRYDPEGAEALLDEAGYPRGADGMRFKAAYIHFPRFDVSWVELCAAYWREIGVDVVIDTPTYAEYSARQAALDFDLVHSVAGVKADPLGQLGNFRTDHAWNRNGYSDAEFDALFDAREASATMDEAYALSKELDMQVVENHWLIWGPLGPAFTVHQPWVIGYNAEGGFGGMQNMVVFSRLWIDHELKTEMGH